MSFDLHTHTVYCDGKNTPEEMVRAALDAGLECIGFSGHGYAPYDTDACMTREGEAAYRAEIAALREKYAGRIRILLGIERDYWSEEEPWPYDYVIGSVHYVKKDGAMLCVDNTPEVSQAGVDGYFGGDWYAFAEAYFATVADVVNRTRCQIIGHFDLIAKFNEKEPRFDPDHPRYVAAWRAALDRLLPSGVPFEINTGAISRLWRTEPYPDAAMRRYIMERGGRFVLSSDSHSDKTLCFGFERWKNLGDCLIKSVDELPFP